MTLAVRKPSSQDHTWGTKEEGQRRLRRARRCGQGLGKVRTTAAWGVCLGGSCGRMGHENGTFLTTASGAGGSEDQTLEAAGPQEGGCRVQSGHYWGSWCGDGGD